MAVRLILASWAQKRLIPYFLDMMYVEFMTNFFSPIRASWWLLDSFRHPEPKTFDPYFLDMMYVDFMKNFLLPDSSELMAVRLISASWAQKRLIPYFLDMMYVEFMKNFVLADSSELMAVRLISASSAQKRLIPTFWIWCTSSSWKIFLSPIRASWWLLDSFRPPEPKNVWFLLSRHDVSRVHEKFSSRRFERADGC